jgi:hypothetical protein
MKYTTNRIEVTKGRIYRTERRVARQREIVERGPKDGEFGIQAQALLLVMEQSLLSMVRFLHAMEQVIDIENGETVPLRPRRPPRRGVKPADMPPALTLAEATTDETATAPASYRGAPTRRAV